MAILDPTTDFVNETNVFIKLTVEGVDGWEYLLPAAAGLEAGEIGRVRQSSIMGKGKSRSCPNWRIGAVSTLTHHEMQLRPTHDVMKMIVLVFRLEPAAATSDGESLQLVALGVREKFLDRIFPNRIKNCREKRPLIEIARVGTTAAVGFGEVEHRSNTVEVSEDENIPQLTRETAMVESRNWVALWEMGALFLFFCGKILLVFVLRIVARVGFL